MKAVWEIAVAVGLAAGCAGQERSAGALIERLCRHGDEMIPFSCGPENAERRMAEELAAMGAAALPELEKKVRRVEQGGWQECSVAGSWLLEVYAKIAGRAALPAIERYRRGSHAGEKGWVPRDAMALALGITSYVTDRDPSLPVLRCNRGGAREPRDALNAVLVGHLKGDRKWMKEHLGPQGQAALRKIRTGTPKGGELGYKLEIAGFWGEAGEPLTGVKSGRGPLAGVEAPEIETTFVDRTGARCGAMKIRFRSEPWPRDIAGRYVVDSAELGAVLAVAGGCAAR